MRNWLFFLTSGLFLALGVYQFTVYGPTFVVWVNLGFGIFWLGYAAWTIRQERHHAQRSEPDPD